MPMEIPSHHEINKIYPNQQTKSKKRKFMEMRSFLSSASSPLSEIDGSLNPVKRLRRDLDCL